MTTICIGSLCRLGSVICRRNSYSNFRWVLNRRVSSDSPADGDGEASTKLEVLMKSVAETPSQSADDSHMESDVKLAKPNAQSRLRLDVASLNLDTVKAAERAASDVDRRLRSKGAVSNDEDKLNEVLVNLVGRMKIISDESTKAKEKLHEPIVRQEPEKVDPVELSNLLQRLNSNDGDNVELGELLASAEIEKGSSTSANADTPSSFGKKSNRNIARKSKRSNLVDMSQRQSSGVTSEAQVIIDAIPLSGGKSRHYFDRHPKTNPNDIKHRIDLSFWHELNEREKRISEANAPRNLMDKMAEWTDEGKLWRFPIDNEQDIPEDEIEPFHEHVFLEAKADLDSWCGKTGPIRHFMHLVCVGLQHNPYLAADRKRAHVQWFKDYFMQTEKQEIIKMASSADDDVADVAL